MFGRNAAAGTADLEWHGHGGEQPSVTRVIVKIPLVEWQEDCPNPGEAQRHLVESQTHRTASRLFFVLF